VCEIQLKQPTTTTTMMKKKHISNFLLLLCVCCYWHSLARPSVGPLAPEILIKQKKRALKNKQNLAREEKKKKKVVACEHQ
jgi:hypothetical protein